MTDCKADHPGSSDARDRRGGAIVPGAPSSSTSDGPSRELPASSLEERAIVEDTRVGLNQVENIEERAHSAVSASVAETAEMLREGFMREDMDRADTIPMEDRNVPKPAGEQSSQVGISPMDVVDVEMASIEDGGSITSTGASLIVMTNKRKFQVKGLESSDGEEKMRITRSKFRRQDSVGKKKRSPAFRAKRRTPRSRNPKRRVPRTRNRKPKEVAA